MRLPGMALPALSRHVDSFRAYDSRRSSQTALALAAMLTVSSRPTTLRSYERALRVFSSMEYPQTSNCLRSTLSLPAVAW